ncbi:DUF305 domain-containing protein [Methylotenera mobilis]|jgi:uncharacterized protein (DUF305 family)|uniref:DUF305 domain-containing protein n=1 Tax=Methylotenera mobilis TaxID=359408 RepID=UPI00037BC0E6|nr:DUF305 domain-containing protein [Methylotenera mobilis]MDP3008174.1 DUF305 domain-containing protein [Methylococcales bacterium]PPC93286.1 MAG: DUF305 domain-containing protein [Methylotenera sp.]
MKITPIHFLKVCITAVLFTSLLGIANADERKNMKGSDSIMHTMQDGMKKMESMKMSGDVDKDFAMIMKMHHQQALDMAQIEIDQGKSSEMKAMAKKIVSAQKKEIAEFDTWLSKQK